jgi:hypothetical protein
MIAQVIASPVANIEFSVVDPSPLKLNDQFAAAFEVKFLTVVEIKSMFVVPDADVEDMLILSSGEAKIPALISGFVKVLFVKVVVLVAETDSTQVAPL